MLDPFTRWLAALEQRHLQTLSFQEVRRSVQSLSALYVERRERIGEGHALDGAGKRAAFATYFAPLHFMIVREIVRALGAGKWSASEIVDLGCGSGVASSAWALEMNSTPLITGIDRNAWAVREAKWTYEMFDLKADVRLADLKAIRIRRGAAVIAAFAINELPDAVRTLLLRELLSAARAGSPVLLIEPIARRLTSWWPDWVAQWVAGGGREDEWRFSMDLPDRLALMDKAAGLDHHQITGRSLWIANGPR